MQDSRKDFFISYNGKDRTWAEWIAWQLEAEAATFLLITTFHRDVMHSTEEGV